MLSIEYCARAIIQYLDGNVKLFEEYRDKAIEIIDEDVEEMKEYKIKRLAERLGV